MPSYIDTLKWIAAVMEATGCSEDVAILALLDTGSIEDAIEVVNMENAK